MRLGVAAHHDEPLEPHGGGLGTGCSSAWCSARRVRAAASSSVDGRPPLDEGPGRRLGADGGGQWGWRTGRGSPQRGPAHPRPGGRRHPARVRPIRARVPGVPGARGCAGSRPSGAGRPWYGRGAGWGRPAARGSPSTLTGLPPDRTSSGRCAGGWDGATSWSRPVERPLWSWPPALPGGSLTRWRRGRYRCPSGKEGPSAGSR